MEKILYNGEYFSPKDTLECGQIFRYKPSERGYFVCAADKRAEVYTQGENTVIETEYPNFFANYFDLGRDYSKIVKSLQAFPEVASAAVFGKGIRILNQELFENTVSFIISANNNIKRIQAIIERLCTAAGEDKGDYFAFPTREAMLRLSRDDFADMGMGYRADYMYSAVRTFPDVEKDIISANSGEEARKYLMMIKGVGEKVANCISLFALKHTRSYPVDTWIFKANSTPQLNTPQKVQRHFLERYGELAGYAQQYVFYAARKGVLV